MSVAVAEAVLEDLKWGREYLADKFVEAFRRDERKGYARGFQAFLESTPDGAAFLRDIRPDSDKSGAAMRACPAGLYPDPREVLDRCARQARLTHDTPDGTDAACAAALLAHYCAYDLGPPADAGRWIEKLVQGQWSVPWEGKVGPKGWMSVRAAITAVSRATSLSGLLVDCVDFTGDVDTVAAIAVGAASTSGQIDNDLPDALRFTLEDGDYGRSYLADLDRRLAEKFGLPRVSAGSADPAGGTQ